MAPFEELFLRLKNRANITAFAFSGRSLGSLAGVRGHRQALQEGLSLAEALSFIKYLKMFL